jgi:hypothetical protein
MIVCQKGAFSAPFWHTIMSTLACCPVCGGGWGGLAGGWGLGGLGAGLVYMLGMRRRTTMTRAGTATAPIAARR